MAKKKIESIINTRDASTADVIILSAPYGQSYTYGPGAEKGPKEIVDCLHGNLEFYDRFIGFEPYKKIRIAHRELKNLNSLSPDKMVQAISDFKKKHSDRFVMMLGGDHSVSIGAFHYFYKNEKPNDVTIFQIDAHPDLRDNTFDYKDSSHPYSHASVMRRGHEWGFKTVQVGLRTISIFDQEYITKNKLTTYEWGRGTIPKVSDIIKSVKTKKVYLTIDVDGLDPAHTPATGTPVPGGLEWHYTRQLIRELIKAKDLVGADIVEVAPIKGAVLTQYAAAQLAYDISTYRSLKQHGVLKFL